MDEILPSGTVTFLFTDIEGSTPLWEKMPREMASAVAQHHAILRAAIEGSGGQVFQVIGDAFQAAFRLAPAALNAAIAAQRGLQSAAWGASGALKVRMGIHTGPAELDPLGNAPYAVSHTLNRAARIMSAGHGGQVLLSQEASDLAARELPDGTLLKDLGEHHLKGLSLPEHLYQASAPGLPGDFPSLTTGVQPQHNLPVELTSFIGRENQIHEVGDLLREHRLVTLTGSGGTGKTRLALRVAAEQLAAYPDGAWLVELAPLADSEGLAQAVSGALGLQKSGEISYQAILLNYLQKKRLLLVLDNCEHLLEACARLAHEVLLHCPEVTLLATSREALNTAGETSYRVPSLTIPDPASLSPDELARSEALRLFAERAAAIRPGFQLTPENLPAAAQICRRLDGIPLALELAAARVGVLSVEEIAGRLDDRFRLLTGGSRNALPRQRTLRASIDWSFSLLPEIERSLLQRLSIFSGGWMLPAAEQVCAQEDIAPWEILDGLASLVNKSLVLADHRPGDQTRYHMLETIRQYAQERLEDAGQAARVRDAHLGYYLTLTETYEALLKTPRIGEALNRLDFELDNLRAALNWALGSGDRAGAGQAARIACALSYFWEARGLGREAIAWLERALPTLSDADPEGAALRARTLLTIGVQYGTDREAMDKVRRYTEESARLYRQLGDRRGLAMALALNYASLFIFRNEWIPTYEPFSIENAPAIKTEGLGMAADLLESDLLPDRWAAARTYFYFSLGARFSQDPEAFLPEVQQARAIFAELGDRYGEVISITLLILWMAISRLDKAMMPISRQEPDRALIETVLSQARSLNLFRPLALLSSGLGMLALSEGRYLEMVDYLEEHGRLALLVGNIFQPIWVHRMVGMAWLHLGDTPAARGRLREGLNLALQHADPNGVLSALVHLGGVAAASQDPRQAARLLGFVERQYEGFFKAMDAGDVTEFDRYTAQAKAALGEADYRALWRQGREMTMEAALDLARKV